MDPILTRAQSRELDERVIEAGVPSLILMENAGRGAAEVIRRKWPSARLLVVCGSGNNAGDGLVVARHWLTWGASARVWLTTRTLSPDAQAQLHALEACGGATYFAQEGGGREHGVLSDRAAWEDELARSDVLVDALFGTGLSRPVNGEARALIEAMNQSGKPIVALDVPSGLDCDRGVALGTTVQAHTTVCFAAAKRATATTLGRRVCGEIEVSGLGVPLRAFAADEDAVWLPSDADVHEALEHRPRVTHKGQAGHVVVVAGALGTTGAALLAARGAFRAGAGLVTIATHVEVAQLLETQSPEVMKTGLHAGAAGLQQLERLLQRATSVVIGPGLGLTPQARDWVEHVVNRFAGPVVVDADAITACRELTEWSRRGNLVFTPHPGEAARLLDVNTADVEADRFEALDRLVQHMGNVVLLKGAPSLIGWQGLRYVNRSGAACMSTAGSGDVLSGIIGALACQLDAFDGAWVGAWLHAAAGELWAHTHGQQRGMLAGELADNVPHVLARLDASRRVVRN